MDHGMRKVDVFVKGPDQAVRRPSVRCRPPAGGRATIQDVTPVPHNGCRPPKRRRV